MSNKETIEVVRDFEKKILHINFFSGLVQQIFGTINQKVEQVEREGDDLLKVNPRKFHNIATAISVSVSILFFSIVALFNYFK